MQPGSCQRPSPAASVRPQAQPGPPAGGGGAAPPGTEPVGFRQTPLGAGRLCRATPAPDFPRSALLQVGLRSAESRALLGPRSWGSAPGTFGSRAGVQSGTPGLKPQPGAAWRPAPHRGGAEGFHRAQGAISGLRSRFCGLWEGSGPHALPPRLGGGAPVRRGGSHSRLPARGQLCRPTAPSAHLPNFFFLGFKNYPQKQGTSQRREHLTGLGGSFVRALHARKLASACSRGSEAVVLCAGA